jgi:hypothetical protein
MQQIVVEPEQASQPLLQVRLQRLLVRQQPVERTVQPVVVDSIRGHAQKIIQRRAPVPVLGDVQLARRFAQPRDHQDRRHRRPCNALSTRNEALGAEAIEIERPPQNPPQPHIAKAPAPLQTHPIETHRDRLGCRPGRLEQLVLLGAPRDLQRQPAGPRAPLPIQLAQLRHRLLHHLAATPHRPHQPPHFSLTLRSRRGGWCGRAGEPRPS